MRFLATDGAQSNTPDAQNDGFRALDFCSIRTYRQNAFPRRGLVHK
jgi:hypothetical protein